MYTMVGTKKIMGAYVIQYLCSVCQTCLTVKVNLCTHMFCTGIYVLDRAQEMATVNNQSIINGKAQLCNCH